MVNAIAYTVELYMYAGGWRLEVGKINEELKDKNKENKGLFVFRSSF